ncbi:hypothetical protein BDR06DRAFT_891746 [Suillus hirtellus]|nr:hypothetical protein BDR06DRAFT_891746 [Suillus hirtellus]
MSTEEKCALEALQQSCNASNFGECGFNGDNDFGTNVLDGSEPIDISHAGGELQELTRKLVGGFWKMRCTQAFDTQMSALTDTYMDWHLVHSMLDGQGFFSHYLDVQDMNGLIEIKVVDVFYAERIPLDILSTDTFIMSALICQGVQFYPYLSCQFSIALDIYLQILANVDSLVHQVISHSDPIWCLKHACPACTYMLKGEIPLKFSLLYTMDGNDLLK